MNRIEKDNRPVDGTDNNWQRTSQGGLIETAPRRVSKNANRGHKLRCTHRNDMFTRQPKMLSFEQRAVSRIANSTSGRCAVGIEALRMFHGQQLMQKKSISCSRGSTYENHPFKRNQTQTVVSDTRVAPGMFTSYAHMQHHLHIPLVGREFKKLKYHQTAKCNGSSLTNPFRNNLKRHKTRPPIATLTPHGDTTKSQSRRTSATCRTRFGIVKTAETPL